MPRITPVVVCDCKSGATGAGKELRRDLQFSELDENFKAYNLFAHRHTPEIEQALYPERAIVPPTVPVTLSFTPTLAPMPRGILATCTARLAPGATAEGLREALAAAYDGEPFVHLLPEGQWPGTGSTLGSNAAHLQVTADTHAGRAIVISALDNLGKGAAGQAVQNANFALGLEQTLGLRLSGVLV